MHTVTAQLPSAPTRLKFSKNGTDNRLQAALEHARRLTQIQGIGTIETVLAWETVEELRACMRHQPTPKSAFERYCEENPDALECRIYGD
ncbi:MAG: Calvin cycle protein CP12 [Cyanobacteria bacterium P01_H01_bin.119]